MKKSFLITGSTKGIGLATSHYLNELGHHVVGVARNKQEKDVMSTIPMNRMGEPSEIAYAIAFFLNIR